MNIQNKKVLILYTSIGLGHKSIAENIGFYLVEDGYEVRLEDAQKVQGGVLAEWGAKIYGQVIEKFPFVWDWLYNTRWFITATLPFRTWIAGFNYNHILKVVKEYQPDVIISTQNTASAVVSYLKQKKLYTGNFGIAFSDFHLHRFWLFSEADFYLANIEEQKQEMVNLGISRAKIFVCGMTLKPKPEVDIASAKKELGIAPGEKVVLLASGSMGTGVDEKLIKKLIAQPGVKVIVVCGKNKKLEQKLSQDLKNTSALILGYYFKMHQLYAISDIFITKPGGVSVAEALQWKLPMVISHLLPGQEIHNYNYLISHKLIMPQPTNLVKEIFHELKISEFRKSLEINPQLAKILGNGERIELALK